MQLLMRMCAVCLCVHMTHAVHDKLRATRIHACDFGQNSSPTIAQVLGGVNYLLRQHLFL